MIVRHCDNCGKIIDSGLYLKVSISCDDHLVTTYNFPHFPQEGEYCSAKCIAEKYEDFP